MAAVTIAVSTWTQIRRNFSNVSAKVCFAKEQLTYVDWRYLVCSKWRAAISTFPCSTLIARRTHFDRVVLTQILHCRFVLTKSDEAFFFFLIASRSSSSSTTTTFFSYKVMVPKFDCCFHLPLNSLNAFLKCAIVAGEHVS